MARTFISAQSPLLGLLYILTALISTAAAASAVLGVDLGTEYIKATLVKPGIPLEIVLTKDSRRKELSAVAFKPPKKPTTNGFPERAYGSDAVALAARFPGDVYPNLKTLLGLPVDHADVQEWASRRPALRLEEDKIRGTAALRSSAFADGDSAWLVEEILAMELQSIRRNAESLAGAGSTVQDVVITVPPFYTIEERRAVELATQLAGLRLLELISDGLAVGVNYATSRTFASVSDGGEPEYHLVFDMGAGSTKATILKFQGRTVKDVGKFNKTVQEIMVLGSGWDRNLGGDSLNGLIVDDMIRQFAESKGVAAEAVQKHGRAAAKLWKEAERIRQVLSANTNTQAGFEGLYDDIDFRYKITREDFEALAASHAARVAPVIRQALEMAKMDVKDLDSIILHGGANRTPFVQKELESIVGDAEKIRSNVNADEAAVFGAGFRGASLSTSFRVKDIRCYDIATHAVGMEWMNANGMQQRQTLWHPISHLGAEKQYRFRNREDFTIDFVQATSPSMTLVTQNLTESVKALQEKFACSEDDVEVKLSSRLATLNGEVEVMSLVAQCETNSTTEEKGGVVDSVKGIFGFGKKDQAAMSEEGDDSTTATPSESSSKATSTSTKAETKPSPRTKLQTIPIKYVSSLKGLPQIPPAEMTRMKARIAAFDDSDRSRRLREESLNQLEGYTYKIRDLLDDEQIIAVSTEKERETLSEKSSEIGDWIYADGTEASRDDLKARLKELKDLVTPIETRKTEAETRPQALEKLREAIDQTRSILTSIKEEILNVPEVKSSSVDSSSTVEDEFAGLEDESTTSTTSSTKAEATSFYTLDDLRKPQELLDTIAAWLEEKSTEQSALDATANPVMLSKEIAAKAKQLQDVTLDLIMKSMKQAPTTKRLPPKKSSTSKKSKTTTSSTTTASTATASTEAEPMGNDPEAEELQSKIENARKAAKPGKKVHVEL